MGRERGEGGRAEKDRVDLVAALATSLSFDEDALEIGDERSGLVGCRVFVSSRVITIEEKIGVGGERKKQCIVGEIVIVRKKRDRYEL